MALRVSLLLHISLAALPPCPKVICGHERDQHCGGFPLQANELIVQRCEAPNSICQMPQDASGSLSCIEFNGNQYDRWNPYYGVVGSEFSQYDWRAEGEVCDERESLCELEMFCGAEGKCEPRKGENAECVAGQCQWGLTCTQRKCVPVGSLAVGEYADSQWACKGFTLDDLSHCAAPATSTGKLPIPCASDFDCVGSDGRSSQCVCGLNPTGQRYCNLHRGDAVVQKYLLAAAKLHLKELRWRYYEAVYYPLLQDNPACLTEIFPVQYLYQVYKQALAAWHRLPAVVLLLLVQ